MVPSTTVNPNPGDTKQFFPPRPNWTLASVCTLSLVTAAATSLRFLFLARKPFWFDECFSVEVARLSWHDLVRLMWWREANMSLYYLLLRGWLHLYLNPGFSPFFIRSLSVLFSLAILPAIFWLASNLFDRRVAVIAVALISCNAYSVRYAQEVRSYSLFALLATLSSGFFVAYLREPSRRNRWGYVLASVLAVYAHLYALLLVAAQWLSLPGFSVLGLGGRRESTPRVSASPSIRKAWILIALGALPLLAFVAKTGAGPIRWIPQPGFRDLLEYGEHLAGNAGLPLLLLYAVACLVAILPLRKRLFLLGGAWDCWARQFLLIWLLFPVALTTVVSLVRPVFLGRYFIFCLPALLILAAAGLASLRKTWMMAICLAVMLLLSLQGTLSYYEHDFDLERDGSEAAADYIYNHVQPGDAILFHIAEARIPYEFFVSLREKESGSASAARPEIIFPRHGDRLDYRDVTGNPTSEFLRSLPGKYARIWVVLMSNGTPGHPDPTTSILSQILGESFPRKEQVQFPQMEVRLYSKP